MPLSARDYWLFSKLQSGLLRFSDAKRDLRSGDQNEVPDGDTTIAIREALFQNRKLIDAFIAQNPCKFTPEELKIVGSWKHAEVGNFYILRSLKTHAIFLGTTEGRKPSGDLFRVLGLTEPFHEIVKSPLPVLVRTALLPFRGKIIFDGIMSFCEVDFGNEVRENLDWIYEYRKEKSGIVTSLDAQGPARPRRKPEESQMDEEYARQFLGDEVFERVYKPQEKSSQQRGRKRRRLKPTVAKRRAKPTTKKPKR